MGGHPLLAIARTPGREAAPQTPAARACGSLPRFDKATADEIMAGRVTFAPWPAATVDPHQDGTAVFTISAGGDIG